MRHTIYVYLLNEGTDCWRPVEAAQIDDDLFSIDTEEANDDESWQFHTGEIVRCRPKTFADGTVHLVAYERVRLSG
jgi:hypothetical protein